MNCYPQGVPKDPAEDPVRAKKRIQFRYESGLWRFCGVS